MVCFSLSQVQANHDSSCTLLCDKVFVILDWWVFSGCMHMFSNFCSRHPILEGCTTFHSHSTDIVNNASGFLLNNGPPLLCSVVMSCLVLNSKLLHLLAATCGIDLMNRALWNQYAKFVGIPLNYQLLQMEIWTFCFYTGCLETLNSVKHSRKQFRGVASNTILKSISKYWELTAENPSQNSSFPKLSSFLYEICC